MYVGRFAPSPTGPLHFGSLVAAVGSYLQARTLQGRWLVRMEDLDQPREMPGAADDILRTLEAYGFAWDGAVMYQSRRQQAYAAALEELRQAGLIYPCACTRKEIADSALLGIDGPVYPGTCASGLGPGKTARAWRVRTASAAISFDDAIQGTLTQNLQTQIGDFVLKRADGLFAYQLAVVVDDAAQGVTHIVRGADLLDSTPRQIYLQQLLGYPQPAYAHLPIAANTHGEKLSKQTLAQPLAVKDAPASLYDALRFLGQQPDTELRNASVETLWQWALVNWKLQQVPKTRLITLSV